MDFTSRQQDIAISPISIQPGQSTLPAAALKKINGRSEFGGPAQVNVKDVFCSANHCASDRARILRRLSALAILRISETGPQTGFEDCGQTELRKV
jgi:hypothetical protein